MHLSLSADQVNCGLSRGKVKKQKKQNFSAPVKASFYSDVNNLQDLLAALSWKRRVFAFCSTSNAVFLSNHSCVNGSNI